MIKIKTIITALANPTLHEKLKETNKYNLPIKDIQYQEGLIDYLKESSKIDALVISEILPGTIEKKEFIEKIRSLNYEIKIIIILEKENIEFINFLKTKNIYNIFLDSKVNLDEIINAIDRNVKEESYSNIPKELLEEINYLKQAITKKNKILDKIKILLKKCVEKIKRKNKNTLMICKKSKKRFLECNKIISILGTPGSRKVYNCFNISLYYGERT